MTAHKHAENGNMRLYYEDALESETPWDRWEWKRSGKYSSQDWANLNESPRWASSHQYRRKPRMLSINDKEFPEPCRVEPERDVQYWWPSLVGTVNSRIWTDGHVDNNILANGALHLTQEAAQQHLDAILAVTRKEGA